MYSDENDFYFMNPNSFEQININKNIMGEKGKMLVENLEVLINFYNDKPLNIILPNSSSVEALSALENLILG